MHNNIIKLFSGALILITTLSFGDVYASNCINCTVKHVGCSYLLESKETCNVVLNEEISGKPSCATGGGNNRYVIDITRDAGKAMFSLATAAQAASKKVVIYGTGECDLLSNYESSNLIYLSE